MRYLSLGEVLWLHQQAIAQTGGAPGVRDLAALESAVAQPRATFDHADLYPTLIEKAAALCFAIVLGYPFVDGNKRAGHAALETFLVLNGQEIDCPAAEAEQVVLSLAAGTTSRHELSAWLTKHVRPRGASGT